MSLWSLVGLAWEEGLLPLRTKLDVTRYLHCWLCCALFFSLNSTHGLCACMGMWFKIRLQQERRLGLFQNKTQPHWGLQSHYSREKKETKCRWAPCFCESGICGYSYLYNKAGCTPVSLQMLFRSLFVKCFLYRYLRHYKHSSYRKKPQSSKALIQNSPICSVCGRRAQS